MIIPHENLIACVEREIRWRDAEGSVIAALYIDPRGPYVGRTNVDPWDESRDAKLYDGPYPVVAHPPCGPWGRLRHLSRRQDPICGPRAVEQVRRFGGVLEHPAHSKLWAACKLARPGELPDEFGGITIEVNQVDWGHVARKPTWLYLVGVRELEGIPASREPTHWISGGRKPRRGGGSVPRGIKVCSEQQRRRTPPAFADWLLSLASKVRR
jgi:hypothetical protein